MKLEKINRDVGRFLNKHWVVKWFVLPIWFMSTLILFLFITVSSATMIETIQIVGLFLVFSLSIVGIGIGIEYGLYKLTGLQIFQSRNNNG